MPRFLQRTECTTEDLVQRRASKIQEYLLIDPTLKVDTNVVDQVEIIVNND